MKFSLPANKSSRKGFTLIELMIAISVVAILSTVGLLMYSNGQKLARDTKRKDDLRQIKNSLMLYYNDLKRFPVATTWITSGTNGAWIPELTANYIDRMPRDPFNTCAAGAVTSTATCFVYGYFTLDSSNSNCPANEDQHFILAASLENAGDPLANSKQTYTLCDGTTFTNPNLYVIANNQ